MAVNTVQQLVNRRDVIEKELKDINVRLTRLREAHHIFWATLQKRCKERTKCSLFCYFAYSEYFFSLL